jgi:AcrR family transcriptional regulator
MKRSHTPKGKQTRERIIAAAEALLAERGFHGTSMRDVAGAAELPLASTIYHFAKKEQLYRAVLEGIAEQLMRELPAGGDPIARVDALAHALVRWAAEEPARARLLLRELLDNPTRVKAAARLPLGPFLETAAAMVSAGMRAGVLEARTPETAVLHVVGGLHYVVVARPTVERIVGAARAKKIEATYEREAIAFARHTLGVPAAYARQADHAA